jgi:two-component system, NarL family, invasion response regulator UvrY
MKLLIVDDHAVVRSGLRRLLQSSPESANFELVEAADGARALELFEAERPDVSVVDINLPGIGGLELLRRLIARDPALRSLVFSMHAEPIYATQALRAGALGYVSKIAPPNEIVDAIRSVAAGTVYIDRQIAQELALSSIAGGGDTPNQASPALSMREAELLKLLGEGRSLAEMADAIGVSYKTVANALTALKSRLGVSNTSELVRLAIKRGYAP